MITGWKIDPECRARLLELFPPRYPRLVADHVTRHASADDAAPPPPVGNARIVGHVDDAHGLEALVVAIDGSTQRPDGGTWHVPWSLAAERHARESNAVLARWRHETLDGGPIRLIPAVWPSD